MRNKFEKFDANTLFLINRLIFIYNLFIIYIAVYSFSPVQIFRKIVAVALMLFIMATATTASYAAEDRTVGFLTFQFIDTNESYNYFQNGQLSTTVASGTFTEEEKRAIEEAGKYWVERIIPNGEDVDGVSRQIIIRVVRGGTGTETGSLVTEIPTTDSIQTTTYHLLTQNGRPDVGLVGGYDALIILGDDISTAEPSRLVMDGDSVTAKTLHELGHILGMTSSYTVDDIQTSGRFGAALTPWEKLLFDIYGDRATPGGLLLVDSSTNSAAFNLSDLCDDYRSAHADGKNITAIGTLPVTGARLVQADDGSLIYALDKEQTLIHPGDILSIMADHGIRNSAFLDIELAAFEDMGYTLRRNEAYGATFYQKSNYDPSLIYVSGDDWTSALSYAVGVHLRTDDLIYVQIHDITTSGTAAGGIRIDGVGNTLWINPTAEIEADGDRGTGVLVSYGSDNVIVHRGSIRADGNYGYGIQFEASRGDLCSIYENPYDQKIYDPSILENTVDALRDLDGPLVSQFHITGSISGKSRSISIGRDAFVEEIHVMAGASLQGDIVSEYIGTPCREATLMTFGYRPSVDCIEIGGTTENPDGSDDGSDTGSGGEPATDNGINVLADADGDTSSDDGTGNGDGSGESTSIGGGVATRSADADFRFTFSGAVRGKTNIDMHTVGGVTTFTGSQVQFRNGTIGSESTLVVEQRVEFGGDLEVDNGASIHVFADENWFSLLKVQRNALLTGGHISVFGTLRENLPYEFIQAGNVCNIRQLDATLYDRTTGAHSENLSSGFTPWSYWYRDVGTQHTFLNSAITWNEAAVAAQMDALRPTARNDMEYIQAHLDVLLDQGRHAAYRLALNELGGEVYGSTGIMGIQGMTLMHNGVLNTLRQTHLCTSDGKPHKYDAWALGYGMGGQGYQNGNAHRLDYSLGGTVVGIGTRNDRDDRLGFYFAYGRTHLTVDTVNQSMRSDDFFFGAFFKKRLRNGHLLGFAGGGFNDYNARRRIDYIDREARSNHKGGNALFYVERALQFRTKLGRLHPFIGLQYAGIYQDRFHETGAGAADLHVASSDTDSLRMMLGLRVNRNFYVKGYKISTDVHGHWMHEYFDKTFTPVRAQFTDYAGASFCSDRIFSVHGLDIGRDWGVAGFGLQFDNGILRGYLGYDLQVNECMTIHTGTGGIVYGW